MRKFMAAGLIGLAFLVSACGGSDTPAPTKTVYVAPENSASSDQQYLSDVADDMSPALYSAQQSDVLTIGHGICTALDNGRSIKGIVDVGLSNGVSGYDIGVMIAAAINNFCPSHREEAERFVRQYGDGNA